MEALLTLMVFGFLAFISGAQNTTSPSHSPSYLIAISQVRPGFPTTISVTILTPSPILVISEIIHGNVSMGQTQTTIKGGSTGLQVLPLIPKSNLSYWYPYELLVRGYSGGTLVFTNSTMLRHHPKSLSILLQTDKSNYKPGETVRIRAVVITPNGKPRDGQIDLVIMNPRGNKIRQWLSVNTELGTAAVEFQLSENPPLGRWKIVATANDVTQEKQFLVDLYVLPKFEVLLEAPAVLYYEDHLTCTVTARYFYGKPVVGILNVIYAHGFHGVEAYFREQRTINGVTDLSFDVPALYREKRSDDYIYQYYEAFEPRDYIRINVQVTDQLTHVTHNSSVKISIAMFRYILQFEKHPLSIKPSLNFSTELRLSTYDNRPLNLEGQSENVMIKVSQQTFSPWTFGRDDPELQPRNHTSSHPFTNDPTTAFTYPYGKILEETFQLPVPADGVIPFQIQLSDNVATLTLEAQFEDSYKTLQWYRSYSSPSRSYIQLKSNSVPQMGRPLHMTLESNFALTKFHYLVVSQAQVVAAGTLKSSSFTLSPELSWVPLANILVYCIFPDGEIVHDSLEVYFTQVLRNNVSLRWERERAQPAELVTLSASVVEENSFVGILIVDKASQDPDRSNDITEKKVIEELTRYSTDVSPLLDGQGMSDPYSTFMMGGITVLTDSLFTAVNVYARPDFSGEGMQLLSTSEEPDQRKNFPETWLWLNAPMRELTTSFVLGVPDSMTSWVATAFVISENLGLGVSEPAELEVFKDFFLSLNLPAYIIRGELLLLEVNLFNYMDQDMEVLVIMDESTMFEFVTSDAQDVSMMNMHKVFLYSHNSTTVRFPIRATELGPISISVGAGSLYASDYVMQTILVKPEGMEQSFTQTLFLEFGPSQSILMRKLDFLFPAEVVPGSQSAQVTAVGDILGPSISGLDSLIQMPYGCGEQNMIHFAPNIYVLQYLTNTGQNDEETRGKALNYMMQGYERELSYQRMDGSFSAFGDSDSSGSTWLSAFVLRCFLQARPFTLIDKSVLMRTVSWLVAQQGPNGAFREDGRVIHTELQGGLDGPVSLTAYVLMALLEDTQYTNSFSVQVSAAVNYLTSSLSQGISSNYSLCLVSYALSLAQSPAAYSAITELMNRAQIHNGVPMWSSAAVGLSDSWQPRSADIEMAAYVLLTLYRQGSVELGLSLMKWLSQQRNHLGGYGSTQDTVVALQALSVYAVWSGGDHIDLTITVGNPNGTLATFTINQTNYMLYQSQEIKAKKNLHIQVKAEGRGFALFQLEISSGPLASAWEIPVYKLTALYNVDKALSRQRRDAHTHEAFYLDISVIDFNMYSVDIYICFRLWENQGLDRTGMAILEVGLLTGFTLTPNAILIDYLVRRVETSPGKVIIYLDSVTTDEACVQVPTTMEFKVTNIKDAAVVLYDYYEPRRRSVMTYTAQARQDMPVCFMCGEECSMCQNQDVSIYDSVVTSHHHHGLVPIITLAFLINLLC